MTDDYKMKIEQKINDKPNLKAMAFFLSGNPLVHAMNLDGGVGVDVGFYMYDYIRNNVGDADAKDFAIKLYGEAGSFDAADEYFDNLIVPILGDLRAEQLEKLIEYSNNNSQINSRRKFSNSKRLIKKCMDKKNPQFDYSQYVNFEY